VRDRSAVGQHDVEQRAGAALGREHNLQPLLRLRRARGVQRPHAGARTERDAPKRRRAPERTLEQLLVAEGAGALACKTTQTTSLKVSANTRSAISSPQYLRPPARPRVGGENVRGGAVRGRPGRWGRGVRVLIEHEGPEVVEPGRLGAAQPAVPTDGQSVLRPPEEPLFSCPVLKERRGQCVGVAAGGAGRACGGGGTSAQRAGCYCRGRPLGLPRAAAP